MKTIKQSLQKILTDDILFKQLCEENPWGFTIESSKTLIKVMPSQQWNQFCYKNHWSFSLVGGK